MSLLVGAASNAGGYDLTDSLRFRASASAYLNRTPSSAGNRKTFTVSMWVKRGKLGVEQKLITAYGSNDNNGYFELKFSSSDQIYFGVYTTGSTSAAVFRDPSAWYHVVLKIDTTQASSANRVKVYINNTDHTVDVGGTLAQDTDLAWNNTVVHSIGRDTRDSNNYIDGYITEINNVDGQALLPTSFGETDDNGTWIPKRYMGVYGTNGFYLPMRPTTQATGFNTVLYAGNNGTQAITGVGFTPDFVWIKQRTDTSSNVLSDTIRGAGKSILSNSTSAEDTNNIYGYLSAFNNNGFTVATGTSNAGRTNETSDNYVAWCWDAGGSTVINMDGSITSSVRANPSTGFSIATWTGTATVATVGHGLGVVPSLIIVKNRGFAVNWNVWATGFSGNEYLLLNSSAAKASFSNNWGSTPTTSVFGAGNNNGTNGNTNGMVAYCFADVTGYQKIGSYIGNGSATGPTVTTGFRPAFLLIKRTDTTGTWAIWDATRNASNPRDKYLHPDLSDAEPSDADIDFNDNGFQLKTSFGSRNASGGTYLYLAIAETRNAKFNFDASGNKNNWTPNNINSNASGDSTYDLMSDVPTLTNTDTANFATLNAVDPLGVTPTNGNLTTAYTSVNNSPKSTIAVKTGKWYMEWTAQGSGGGGGDFLIQTVGVISPTNATNSLFSSPAVGYYSYGDGSNGNKYVNDVGSTYGAFWGAAGTYNVAAALDLDGGTITFYLNGASQGAITLPSSPDGWVFANSYGTNSGSSTVNHNFGQRPFAYTIPTGFKKLNTFNLPDSTITDGSEQFDTALWTGNGSASGPTVSSLKFKPRFLWSKRRDSAANHYLYDTVRSPANSPNKFLNTNNTDAEQTFNAFTLADNGFTLATDNVYFNASSGTYVSWNWNTEDTTAVTYTVKVVSDGGNKYRFNDFGTSAVTLNLHETGTYTFDQSDSSNSGHPFRFSTTSGGTHGGGSEYTTGVTVTGTPGSAGAKTVIVVAASAPTLYYYCTVHSGMGGQANTNATNGSSNFSGSIISTVSPNTTANFSIVTYTGTGSNATVGHGLGVALKFLIVKGRDAAEGWTIQSQIITGNTNGTLHFNTDAEYTGSSTAFQGTVPTSTVFSIGTAGNTNNNTQKYVAYCFADVEGYSKFGSYTGNGSADGPFIYTGFRPAFVMLKKTNGASSWYVYDTSRNTFNVADTRLYPNLSSAEGTGGSYGPDILSNGFKLRTSDTLGNTNGGIYIYMAFAENPFKNSNAR